MIGKSSQHDNKNTPYAHTYYWYNGILYDVPSIEMVKYAVLLPGSVGTGVGNPLVNDTVSNVTSVMLTWSDCTLLR